MNNPLNDYKEVNRKAWNDKLDYHVKSDFYDLKGFMAGANSLNQIELDLLGNVHGKSILHLQCHFGQDSISLSRLGAKVTGIDISDKSIDKARELAKEAQSDAEFICCDLYDLPNHLNKEFDIVFTSYGTIIWLPDLTKWAQLIARFMKDKGKFIFVDFHPFIWMYDDEQEKIIYPYHNENPIIEVEEGTYADSKANLIQQNITWNHSISEVVNALIHHGIQVDHLMEYDYAPYPFVKNCKEYEPGRFRITHFQNKVPLVYSIWGSKTDQK